MSPGAAQPLLEIDQALLRAWPLPQPHEGGGKEERGRTLVVAGSREMPGAALLAGLGVLRAGAGKLAIATAASVAAGVALALPEARVIGLTESADGGFSLDGTRELEATLRKIDAVLIGPGMIDEAETCGFTEALLPLCGGVPVIIDAAAMGVVGNAPRFARPVLLTPHAGEMAHLTGDAKEEIEANPEAAARAAARRWNAVVALKGARTHIATPEGEVWRHKGGNVGLGTSGSGDTLAGIIAGLLARGATLTQSAAWGVALHARAGHALGARHGPLGYLAREIPAEIPALLQSLGSSR